MSVSSERTLRTFEVTLEPGALGDRLAFERHQASVIVVDGTGTLLILDAARLTAAYAPHTWLKVHEVKAP